MSKEMQHIDKKIDKLLCEYARRVVQKEGELKILFIDFAREYNQIWAEDLENDK